MPRTKKTRPKKTTRRETPQQAARRLVDEYFDDVFSCMPSGDGPNIDLLAGVEEVDCLFTESDDFKPGVFRSHAAFLIGVEVGRRLGGAR